MKTEYRLAHCPITKENFHIEVGIDDEGKSVMRSHCPYSDKNRCNGIEKYGMKCIYYFDPMPVKNQESK